MKDKTAGSSRSKNTVSFNHDQLWAALRDAVDLLDGMHLPGFLLGNTARCAWDNSQMSGDEIVFGIKRSEYTDVVKSILKALRPSVIIEDNEARYLVGEVPVRIKVINRKYEFLNNLDRKWYLYDEYLFPNPFEKYYKARFIVQ